MHIKHKLLITFGILAFLALSVFLFNYIYVGKIQEAEAPIVAFDYYLETVEDDNFVASYPAITGYSIVAKKASSYVRDFLEPLRIEAQKVAEEQNAVKSDIQNPKEEIEEKEEGIVEEETENSFPSYSADIGTNYFSGDLTESVVLSGFLFTGGANGTSFYKAFTSFKGGDKLLSIQDIIKPNKRDEFVNLVKNKLKEWRPEEIENVDDESFLFEDVLENLSLNDLESWAIDDDTFILYFDEYAVAPGSVGAIMLEIDLKDVSDFFTF